jgi:hypothetical protein
MRYDRRQAGVPVMDIGYLACTQQGVNTRSHAGAPSAFGWSSISS